MNDEYLSIQSTRRPRNLFHPRNRVTSSNLVWISNELNARPTFKHCTSQSASFIETILTRCVGRSVYSKFIVLLFLLAGSCGGRGSAYSQDSGSNMAYLWFVVQIWAKWSYYTIFAAWVHYNQQYNIPKLEAKSSTSMWNIKSTNLEKLARGIKHTNGRERAINTQPMLPSSSGHLLKLINFITITFSEIRPLLWVPSGLLAAVSDFQLLVQIWAECRRVP